jgi:hypothetical protein
MREYCTNVHGSGLSFCQNVSQKNAWVNDLVNLYTPGEAKNWGVFEGK